MKLQLRIIRSGLAQCPFSFAKLLVLIAILCMPTGCSILKPSGSNGETSTPSKPSDSILSVNASQLGTSVSVIGPLDQPLGKVIVIEGKAVPQSERHDYWSVNMAHNLFGVEKVDGVPLSRPAWIELELPSSLGELKDGNAKFEGYQDGGFENVPGEAIPLIFKTEPQSNGWHIQVVFKVIDRDHKHY